MAISSPFVEWYEIDDKCHGVLKGFGCVNIAASLLQEGYSMVFFLTEHHNIDCFPPV